MKTFLLQVSLILGAIMLIVGCLSGPTPVQKPEGAGAASQGGEAVDTSTQPKDTTGAADNELAVRQFPK